jgi:uncharacterized protein YjiS (DUF1127 family)
MRSTLERQSVPAEPTLRTAADYIFRNYVFGDEPRAERSRSLRAALAKIFVLWRQRRMTRRHLATLDARGLADVGLDSTARSREVAKFFWQA